MAWPLEWPIRNTHIMLHICFLCRIVWKEWSRNVTYYNVVLSIVSYFSNVLCTYHINFIKLHFLASSSTDSCIWYIIGCANYYMHKLRSIRLKIQHSHLSLPIDRHTLNPFQAVFCIKSKRVTCLDKINSVGNFFQQDKTMTLYVTKVLAENGVSMDLWIDALSTFTLPITIGLWKC